MTHSGFPLYISNGGYSYIHQLRWLFNNVNSIDCVIPLVFTEVYWWFLLLTSYSQTSSIWSCLQLAIESIIINGPLLTAMITDIMILINNHQGNYLLYDALPAHGMCVFARTNYRHACFYSFCYLQLKLQINSSSYTGTCNHWIVSTGETNSPLTVNLFYFYICHTDPSPMQWYFLYSNYKKITWLFSVKIY